MKKIIPVLAGFVLATALVPSVKAEDMPPAGAERIHHYEGDVMENAEAATKALHAKVAEIDEILKADKLEVAQLEHIHEISYTLENAIDKLRAEKAGDEATLDTIDEAIQAVHFASENHEEAKVREWFARLKAGVETLA